MRRRIGFLGIAICLLGFGYASAQEGPVQWSYAVHVAPSAAIVDQLSLTISNATFVAEATRLLNESGYVVDYYPGEEVTVDFYKRLPRMGYDVLILRTHSSAEHANEGDDVVIFTGEEYSPRRYVKDQYQGHLSRVAYTPEQYEQDGKSWYGIRPSLIREAFGDFEGAIVLMMGCQGLANPTMAEAFSGKGSAIYAGWEDEVTADLSDESSLRMLQRLLQDAFQQSIPPSGFVSLTLENLARVKISTYSG